MNAASAAASRCLVHLVQDAPGSVLKQQMRSFQKPGLERTLSTR